MMRTSRRLPLAVLGLVATLTLAGCGGAGGGGSASGSGTTINVLATNGSPMQDLQKLTADNFTKQTGIKVNFTLLPENDLRAKLNQEMSSQAGQYDVGSISAYEVPNYAKNGWIAPLSDDVKHDTAFNQSDIFPSLTSALSYKGDIYAEPFYAEGSFTMYRKDLFAKAGVTMPANPTWQQIADLAAKVDGTDGAKGICLRGLAGWGQNMAVVDTMVNTFGGQWFDSDWNAKLNSPQWKNAVNFYVNLLKAHGEPGAAQTGVQECINNFQQGKSAIFYDASSIGALMEAKDSPVKGKVGYVSAPHDVTQNSGWLWTWAWGVENASKNQDAAWKFVSWASSAGYEKLVGQQIGWTKVPAGKRASLYQNTDYQTASAAFYKQELNAIQHSADPTHPGVDPQPYTGVQYVAIPEFESLGQQVGTQISNALAGQTSVDDALAKAQALAVPIGQKYQKG